MTEFEALASFYTVVDSRRDVRSEFTGGAVDPDALVRILAAAHRAPSVGMSQPWDFVIVKSRTTRALFRDHVESERDNFAALLTEERSETFAAIKIEGILEATMGIVVTYDPSRGGARVLGRNTIDETGIFSVCLAIENLWLAATAEGYGVGWVSFYREEFLADLVDLPSPLRPVAWLCFGPVTGLQEVPDLERFGWRNRSPLRVALHSEKYSNPIDVDVDIDQRSLDAPFRSILRRK